MRLDHRTGGSANSTQNAGVRASHRCQLGGGYQVLARGERWRRDQPGAYGLECGEEACPVDHQIAKHRETAKWLDGHPTAAAGERPERLHARKRAPAIGFDRALTARPVAARGAKGEPSEWAATLAQELQRIEQRRSFVKLYLALDPTSASPRLGTQDAQHEGVAHGLPSCARSRSERHAKAGAPFDPSEAWLWRRNLASSRLR